ncbi:YdbL family protein [Sphingomonas montana]|uniref:YdbL family protein n=1 Tax=Sphingomonas montana TaxID=1843236 RepID=UPI001F0B3545|nr:YdbL family protein [Sphingomonas montana]
MKILIAGGLLVAMGGAGVALAQNDDGVVASARASGDVGEQADGYLGFVTAPSSAVKSAVDAVNIKRRAIYTDIAAKQNATVQEVAAARGCDQLAKRVAPGQKYRTGGGWQTRGAAPIDLPAICG